MKPHSSMRIAVQAMMMVFLVAGSAFGLTNITVTSSPYNAVPEDGLNDSAAFGSPVLLRGSNSTFDVDFSGYMTTNHSGYFRLQVR